MTTEKYLIESNILDFSDEPIQTLIRTRGWQGLDEFKRIGKAYNFVRN